MKRYFPPPKKYGPNKDFFYHLPCAQFTIHLHRVFERKGKITGPMPNRTTQGRKCPSKLLRFASPLLFPGEKPTRRDRWLAVTSQLFFVAGTNDYWEGEEREKIEQRRIALPPLPNSQKYWQKYSITTMTWPSIFNERSNEQSVTNPLFNVA